MKKRLFPNPTDHEVEIWNDLLVRCRRRETVKQVLQWAKKYGVVELVHAAKLKLKRHLE